MNLVKKNLNFSDYNSAEKNFLQPQAKVEDIKKTEPPSKATKSEPLRRLKHIKEEWMWKEEQEKASNNL